MRSAETEGESDCYEGEVPGGGELGAEEWSWCVEKGKFWSKTNDDCIRGEDESNV